MAEATSTTPGFSDLKSEFLLARPSVSELSSPVLTNLVPSNNQRGTSVASRLGVYSSLLLSIRAKHAPTAAHCIRVAQSISAWGIYHGVEHTDLEKLELTGLLHDLGKIGIPERILQKPGRLAPEELAIVDLHPRVGVEILKAANIDSSVLNSIEQIGVWFDQSNRIRQGHLPVAQRILSIADAFDAMTSEQVYRPAMSVKQSLAELERMGGTQFDPDLVLSFRDTVLNFNEDLAKAVSARWSLDPSKTLVHLFQTPETQDCNGSAAIESLNSVFHQNMMNRMNDGVIFIDTEFRILEWNQAATRLTGLNRSSILHTTWTPDLIGLCDENGVAVTNDKCPLASVLSTHKTSLARYRIQTQDGRLLMLQTQAMPIFGNHGVLRGGALLMGDASDQVSMEQKMLDLHVRATQDPLTKIANRSELNRQMKQLVDRCRLENIQASVLICDIDYFKRINDTFGHAAGDEALIVFASLLKELSRETDLVARYGGEEFVILCMDCDLNSAIQIGETIRSKLRATPLDALKGKTMTASYGVSQIVPGDDTDSALERADQGLLQAKQSGRDKVIAVPASNDATVESALNASVASEPPNAAKSSWFGWLGSSEDKVVVSKELLTNFLREMVTEKLKGFVSDSKAELVSVEADRVELRIDTRYAPIQRRDSDRSLIYNLTIELSDFELAVSRTSQLSRVTKIKTQITPSRSRDRRTENVIDQAKRIERSFETYLSAYEIPDTIRERLIPVYKEGADGR